jgi:hypothetical protein
MALENQAVSAARTKQEVVRLMNELIYQMPPDFWEDQRQSSSNILKARHLSTRTR